MRAGRISMPGGTGLMTFGCGWIAEIFTSEISPMNLGELQSGGDVGPGIEDSIRAL